eukprot:3469163-Rhodomonas_salina.1
MAGKKGGRRSGEGGKGEGLKELNGGAERGYFLTAETEELEQRRMTRGGRGRAGGRERERETGGAREGRGGREKGKGFEGRAAYDEDAQGPEGRGQTVAVAERQCA